MNRTSGKVSWGSPETAPASNNNEEGKKLPFLEMKGNNKSWKVRVVDDEPLMYWCHFTTNRNGGTAKVNCTLDSTCPVHVEKVKTACGGNHAEARFYLKAIDRSDGTVKVLDVGKQIINAIGGYIDNEDWGHCNGYDITIKKGAKGEMPLYKVEPSPKKPLTPAEEQLIANSNDKEHEDHIDLESRIKPLTADTINKILGNAESSKPVTTTTKKSGTAPTTKTTSPVKPVPKQEDEAFEVNWDEN